MFIEEEQEKVYMYDKLLSNGINHKFFKNIFF